MIEENKESLEQSTNTIEEEPKPQYMRIRTSTKELVNRIANTEDKTQDEFLKSLLSFYQLEKTKELVPGKADIIKELENHLNRINSIVVNLIEHNINVESTVQNKFKDQLIELQEEIESKESKIEKLRNDKAERTKQRDEYKKELYRESESHLKLKQLNYKNEELLQEYKEKLETSANAINSLTSKLETIDNQLEELGLDIFELIKKYKTNKDDLDNLLVENIGIKVSNDVHFKDKQELQLQLKEKNIELIGLNNQLEYIKSELNNKNGIYDNLRMSTTQELIEIMKEYKDEFQNLNVKHKEELMELNEKHREEITKLKEEIENLKSKK